MRKKVGKLCLIYLIRHALLDLPTEYIEEEFAGVEGDPGLSVAGIRQAELLGQALAARNLSAIYTSPALGCVATARRIQAACDVDLTLHRDLRDLQVGVWRGQAWRNVDDTSLARLFLSGTFCPPGGESLDDLSHRMLRFLRRATAQHLGQSIALVSHRLPLQTLLLRVQNLAYVRKNEALILPASPILLWCREFGKIQVGPQMQIQYQSQENDTVTIAAFI